MRSSGGWRWAEESREESAECPTGQRKKQNVSKVENDVSMVHMRCFLHLRFQKEDVSVLEHLWLPGR